MVFSKVNVFGDQGYENTLILPWESDDSDHHRNPNLEAANGFLIGRKNCEINGPLSGANQIGWINSEITESD